MVMAAPTGSPAAAGTTTSTQVPAQTGFTVMRRTTGYLAAAATTTCSAAAAATLSTAAPPGPTARMVTRSTCSATLRFCTTNNITQHATVGACVRVRGSE